MKLIGVLLLIFQVVLLSLLGIKVISFLPISLLIGISFYFSKTGFSFFDLQNLFTFIFFLIFPQIEILNKVSYWGLGVLNTIEIIHANLCLFLYHVTAFIFQFRFPKRLKSYSFDGYNNLRSLLIVVLALGIMYSYYRSSIISLFFRGFEYGYIREGVKLENWEWLVLEHFVRVLPFVCLLIYIWHWKHNNTSRGKNGFMLLILVLSTLVLTFPTGIARFLVGIVYGALVLILFNRYLSSRNVGYLLILGLFFVFPFLDNFRFFNGDIRLNYSSSYFFEGHFDAYFNLAKTINVDITYGQQLLGSLLFFIPRALWQNKPINSGSYVANQLNMAWDNISMPYVAEGYLNFGYFGVMIFAIIMSLIFMELDSYVKFRSPLVFLSVGIIIFMLRGSFMSAYAYGFGLYTAYKVVAKFVLKRL